jgi:hypothetical protein
MVIFVTLLLKFLSTCIKLHVMDPTQKYLKDTKYYRDKKMAPKHLWINAETIYKIEVYAAKQSLEKGHRISFVTIVNEILDAFARKLPDK